jgi:O-antigen ligase
VLGGAAASATGYFLGFDEDAKADEARGRLTLGTEDYQNPNTLGSVLLLPLALAIGGFLGLRGLAAKVTAITAVGVMAVGIFITMSRTSVVALAAMLLVFLWRFRIRFSVLVVVAVLLGAVALMPETFYERMTSSVSGKDTTGSGRLDIWAAGVRALSDHWAIGAGLDNFKATYGRFVTLGGQDKAKVAHNTYLGVWVELGIPGLALMVVALASNLVLAARLRGAQSGAGIALTAIEAAAFGRLVHAFFGESLRTKTFWLIWILLAWATQLAQEKSTGTPRREGEAGPPALVSTTRDQST